MKTRFPYFLLAALAFSVFGWIFFAMPVDAASCCICHTYDEENIGPDYVLKGDDGQAIFSTDKCKAPWGNSCDYKESSICPIFEPAKPQFTTLSEEYKIKDVILGIAIPGLQFSSPPAQVDEQGKIYIPWLAEYLKAIYNYSVVIISIVGVVAIIVQAIRIITSAGGPTKADAYKKITQIIIGLFIAWGSFTVLYTINPGLTAFKPLEVQFIEGQPLPEYIGTVDSDVNLTPMANEALPPAEGDTPYAKLKSVCVNGPLTEATLKAVLPTWVDIGKKGGAVYVRGGHTTNKGCNAVGAQTDWMINWLFGTTILFPNPYNYTKDSIKTLTKEQKLALKQDRAYNAQLLEIYNTKALVNYTGRMCGDCGTWILQLYKCAGFKGVAIPQLKTTAQAPYFLAGGKGISCNKAISDVKGGLKFGDVFWSDARGHWFMYTGGAGLPYEAIEMGGGNSATCKAYGAIPVINVMPGTCVRTAKTISEYWILRDKKKDTDCYIYRFIGVSQ